MRTKRSFWPVVLSVFAYSWQVMVIPNGLTAANPDKTESNLRQLLIESDRVVVLGDSITFSGHWVSYLTCWMETAGTSARVIDMALPSETVSGLSENGHAGGKFPNTHKTYNIPKKNNHFSYVASYAQDGISRHLVGPKLVDLDPRWPAIAPS